MGGNDYTKKDRSTFRKRAPTLIKKAHELAEQCSAHVYVLIDHPRARVSYSSTNGGKTPFPEGALEAMYPGLQQLTQSEMKESHEETHREKVDGVSRYFEFRAQALSKTKDEKTEINTTGEGK
ncbi:uncharacterized protein N7487_000974 [Penicillium crustosum]|uniref:uncharacterized protein n=1 Tax=Penicillium crustosum TaxID=36656 RepID=UPI00238DDA7E|nr:uncharacterized protein N7487_000974 [Penicillium crustosum]KAJ5417424.1 hypothetical protein N7487_000974 [Penicillium crustosum]